MSGKKGDLEVTIIEARNCGVKGHALYCSVEVKTQRNTLQAKTYYTTAAKDAKWNQTFTLDLMSLEGEELLIQLYCKRNVKKDKFLGQSQLRISALNLSKEAEWRYLTDKPEDLKSGETLKSSINNEEGTSIKKKDTFIVSGEILYKLNFIHRLIRAKSKAAITKDVPRTIPPSDPVPPSSNSSHRLSVPAMSPRTYTDFQKSHEAAASNAVKPSDTRPSTASNRRIGPFDNNAKEETTEPVNLQKSTPPEESPVDLSVTEEVIIDEALKEKQKMVKEKLEQGNRLVRHMTSRIIKLETEGSEAAIVREEKNKIEQIKKNMSELEKILESTEDETQNNFSRPRYILLR